MKYRGLWRDFDISHVCMPDSFAITKIADRLAVLNDIGDDIEFRMLSVERTAIGIGPWRIQLAKVSAERDKLRIRERLPAEHDHEALAPFAFDRIDVMSSDRL